MKSFVVVFSVLAIVSVASAQGNGRPPPLCPACVNNPEGQGCTSCYCARFQQDMDCVCQPSCSDEYSEQCGACYDREWTNYCQRPDKRNSEECACNTECKNDYESEAENPVLSDACFNCMNNWCSGKEDEGCHWFLATHQLGWGDWEEKRRRR